MPEAQTADPISNFAPIHDEYHLTGLPIMGELPAGLTGTLFRNGPNPQFPAPDPQRDHWFAGDGMIHAFTIQDGQASYRNRWVRTDKWIAEHDAGRALMSGFGGPRAAGLALPDTGVANTSIVWHAGRLLALEEAHRPFEIDPATLETLGVQDYGVLKTPFTAHPKTDPATGELVFFGYSATGPFSPGMVVGTIGPDSRVTKLETFEAPYASMVHDFAITRRHIIFPIMPLTGSMARAMSGQMPFAWEPDKGTHIGIIDRALGVASLRWLQADPCYVFHILNAWDQDAHRICVDVIQYGAAPLFPRADGRESTAAETSGHLTRWTLDLTAGTDAFRTTQLDDMTSEFPRIDDRRTGLPNRFGAFAGSHGEGMNTIAWLDLAAGRRTGFTLPTGDAVSEPVFVPRHANAAEGDGWLLTVAWRAAEARSDLLVLDTQGIDQGPVAAVQLPHRVPFGFHGNWIGSNA